LAYLISDTVDLLDLGAFYERYEGDGRRNQPFDPRMMVKVILYGYATGCRSSRKLARRLEEDVAFRVLAAENFPAHRTICDFRHDHLEELARLFVQVVQLAREAGLVKLGTVAVDGSKVKANASRHKSMTYKEMQKQEKRLRQEIDRLLAEADRIDAHEDELYGPDNQGDELPEGLRRREDRLRAIQEAKKRLEARQAEADPAPSASLRCRRTSAGQLHGSAEPDHEEQAWLGAVLQRAAGGRRGVLPDRGHGDDTEGCRQW